MASARFAVVAFGGMLVGLVTMGGAACAGDDELDALRGSVKGRVCDEQTGEGLVSTAVTLHMANGNDQDSLTDTDGNLSFTRVAYGATSLEIVDTGRAFEFRVEAEQRALVDDTACRGDPGVPDVGAIDGVICNRHTGELLTEANVIVLLADGTIFATTSDSAGAFFLDSIPTGEQIVNVQAASYQATYAITVVASETAHLDLGDDCVPPDLRQCDEGEAVACYDGPPGTEGRGICRAGRSTCLADGTWTACEGQVLPQDEEIAGNGIDEDCVDGDAPCTPIEVNVDLSGDCVTTQCPAEAPYAVGCQITMQGGDGRGCVANTPGNPVVYFQEGDVCSAGHVEGTLLCSALLCVDGGGSGDPVHLNAQNCPINKSQPMYPDTRDGCPET